MAVNPKERRWWGLMTSFLSETTLYIVNIKSEFIFHLNYKRYLRNRRFGTAVRAFTSSILGRYHLRIFATQNYLQSGWGLTYIWGQWSTVSLRDTRHYLESRTFTLCRSDTLYLEWLVHRQKVIEGKVWLSDRRGRSLSISCWGKPDTLLFDWLLCWEDCGGQRKMGVFLSMAFLLTAWDGHSSFFCLCWWFEFKSVCLFSKHLIPRASAQPALFCMTLKHVQGLWIQNTC